MDEPMAVTTTKLRYDGTCAGCGAGDVDATCDRCGRDYRIAIAPPGSLGASVTLSSGAPGVVLDRQGESLVVLTASGEVHTTVNDLASASELPQSPTSRLGALHRASGAVESPQLVEVVTERVRQQASEQAAWHEILAETLASDPAQMSDVVQLVDLQPQEQAWWGLLAADELEDDAGVLRHSVALPDEDYEARLLIWARALRRPGADRGALGHLVEGFVPDTVLATELHGHLRDELRPSTDASLGAMPPVADARLLLDALAGEVLPEHRHDVLSGIAPALLDDLIDAGSVPGSWVSIPGEHQDQLALRLDPSQASLDAVIEHGPQEELLRRLTSMSEIASAAALSRLDATTAAQLRLRAALASTDAEVALDALEKLLRDDPARAAALRRLRKGTGVAEGEFLDHPDARRVILRHGPLAAIPTDALDAKGRDVIARRRLRAAKELLHDWRFEEAETTVRGVLDTASVKGVRDEALNTIAISRFLRGDAAAAIAALGEALRGKYSLTLQTNLVAMAQGLGLEEESEVLAQLIHDAPSVEMRIEAARRGLAAWFEDDDVTYLLPSLRTGLHLLLREPLDDEALVLFLRILVRFDENWVRSRANRFKLALENRPAFDVFRAQLAGDGDALLRALATAQPAGWADEIADDLARSLVERLNDEDEDRPLGFAHELLNSNVRIDPLHEIVITASLNFHVAKTVVGDGEPSPDFIGFAERATERLSEVDGSHRDDLRGMLREASSALALAFLANRHKQLDELIDGVNAVAGTPRHQLDRAKATSFLKVAMEWTRDTDPLLKRLSAITTNAELREGIQNLSSEVARLRDHVNQMRV